MWTWQLSCALETSMQTNRALYPWASSYVSPTHAGPCHAQLCSPQTSETWQAFIEPNGVLTTLCQEQEGDLGGPRPVRLAVEESGSAMAEMAGGGLISGHEILALLQGMGAMKTMQ